jgi:hypothetical protein
MFPPQHLKIYIVKNKKIKRYINFYYKKKKRKRKEQNKRLVCSFN